VDSGSKAYPCIVDELIDGGVRDAKVSFGFRGCAVDVFQHQAAMLLSGQDSSAYARS
jgi:hypothetical protein